MSMFNKSGQKVYRNESGMAAITIALILMLVISVITLGFARSVRREQRQALDYQLTTQAFYAAESGVNLAQQAIDKQLTDGVAIKKTNCPEPGDTYYPSGSYQIDGTNVAVTCLLVRDELTSQEYTSVDMNSIVGRLKNSAAANLTEIYISWQDTGGSANFASCNLATRFPKTAANWTCGQPLLRVDLVPLFGETGLTRAALQNGQFTSFLYPVSGTNGNTSIGYAAASAGNLGSIQGVQCSAATNPDAPRYCTAKITGVPASRSFGFRILSLYGQGANVSVYAKDTSATRASLIDGQVLIDSTARAADVLRRVEVRVSPTGKLPDFGIVTGGTDGMCKRYAINAGVAQIMAPAAGCDIP